jgi:hypothetical protein
VLVMEASKRVLGEGHPNTLSSMANLAATHWIQGRWKEAEELDVSIMEASKRVLGDEHPDTLTSMASPAYTLRSQRRVIMASVLLKRTINAALRFYGPKYQGINS